MHGVAEFEVGVEKDEVGGELAGLKLAEAKAAIAGGGETMRCNFHPSVKGEPAGIFVFWKGAE